MREELDDLGTANGSGKQAKVKVPPGYPGYRRQHLPVKVILQHWRLSPRRPGPTAMGSFAQSAFVDEDDGTALFLGFFLISGQRSCFHRRILSSSRSSARPTGRWQLHPNCRRIRHSPGCPQAGLVAESFWPTLQTFLDPPQVLRVQARPPADTSRLAQGPFATLLQFQGQTAHGLPMHPDLPRYFRLVNALPQQLSRLQATLF